MFINLEVLSVNGSLRCWADHGDLPKHELFEAFNIEVTMQEHEKLSLQTGELFANPAFLLAEGDCNTLIDASLTVFPDDSGATSGSYLRYYGPRKSGSINNAMLSLTLSLPRSSFDRLKASIQSRIMPKSLSVEFGSDAFDFSWEPDGSHIKWNNSSNKKLPITGVQFNFEHMPKRPSSEDYTGLTKLQDYGDIARANLAIISELRQLLKVTKSLALWAGIITAVLIWRAI